MARVPGTRLNAVKSPSSRGGMVDRFGQEILDMADGDQAELRSLRGHLDVNVVGRLNVLEHVANCAVHYLNTAKTPMPNPAVMSEALGVLVMALDRAGFRV